jgi:hypothetical protein
MVGLVTSELERMWKKAIMAFAWRGYRIHRRITGRIATIWAMILNLGPPRYKSGMLFT